MKPLDTHMLPDDPMMKRTICQNLKNTDSDPDTGFGAVSDVPSFIARINAYSTMHADKNCFCVFRGEPKIYPTPCTPLLFRQDHLQKNKFFEKNLFDTMRQNRLTNEKCYLDNAIDAQHGEFPSRLLDVSYNCLIALYFAVTPYYHYPEPEYDDQDGMVFIFFIDEVFSPSAANTNKNYNAIVNRNLPWFQAPLFQKNHKFIDHVKLNQRITAQQGAFILFQGDEPEPLPKRMYCGLRIPHDAKPNIRSQLKQFFGIHTGSIYPEISNLVHEITSKSCYLNAKEFNCESELCYTMNQMDKELDYYLDYAIAIKQDIQSHHRSQAEQDQQMSIILSHIGRVIKSYQEGLAHLTWNKFQYEIDDCLLKAAIEQYNQQLNVFSNRIDYYGLGNFPMQKLKIPKSLLEQL